MACRRTLSSILVAIIATGCASAPAPEATDAPPAAQGSPAEIPEIRPGVPAGYLGRQLPDSLVLLPPPPVDGSPGFANDLAISRAAQTLKGSARYALATADADLAFPHAAGVFACALGVRVDAQATPRLYMLLRRVLTDAGLATYGAKNHYNRTRPFMHYNEGTCAPADEAALRKDGSYPSGHTSAGWAWALVLAELAPDRTDALLARGRAFGESRLICNAHWQSDILEGRAVAAGTVARLHADPVFRADMDAARAEIEGAGDPAVAASDACKAEAVALDVKIPGVL